MAQQQRQQPDFSNLLNVSAADVKRPPILPNGSYRLRLAKHEFGKSKEKETPYADWIYVPVEAGPDVDASAMQGVELNKKSLRHSFWLTDDAMHRMTEHIKKHGVSLDGKSIKEAMQECINLEIWGMVGREKSQRTGEFFSNLTGLFTPVDGVDYTPTVEGA